MEEIKGKSVVIVGYGREGQSVHRYILDHHPDLKVGIADIAKINIGQRVFLISNDDGGWFVWHSHCFK